MKSNWPTKKLGEVCDLQRGNEPGSRTYNEEGKGIRFIRVADISKQRTSHIWTTGKNLVICNKNDILMTFDGSPGVVFRGIEGAISSGIRIIKPKNSKELLDDFLFYVLQTEPVQNTVKKYTIGVSIWHASKSIPHIEIPLPPIEIQKRIVARIEGLFEKIDKAKELRQKVQEETEQIFQSALQEIFSKAEKKWGMKKIREICEKIKQTHPKNIFKSEFNYIDITSIDPELKSIIGTKRIFVNKAPSRARKLVKEGDILFATTRPYLKNIAYTSKNFDNCIASTGFCVIRPQKELANSFYIFYAVNSESFINQVLPLQRGASYPAVSDSNVYNCRIPLPPLSEQKKIVAYLDDLREKIEKLKQLQQKQLEELTELKNSILDKAFKGELVG